MLEELKLVLPLLEKVTDGALWVIVIHYGYKLLTDLLFMGFCFTAAKFIYAYAIRRLNEAKETEKPLHIRLNTTRKRAAFEAVREWYLWGNGGAVARQMYETLNGILTDEAKAAPTSSKPDFL